MRRCGVAKKVQPA